MVLFDDYRGETPYQEMLRITHEHKYTGNVKGKSIEINPRVVIFTTNVHYFQWPSWKNHDMAPFERRITDLLEFRWVPDPDEPGKQAVEVKVNKGTFLEEWDDPPDWFDGKLTDEQLERTIEADTDSKWLPKRDMRNEVLPISKRPRVDDRAWESILPEYVETRSPDNVEVRYPNDNISE